MFNIICIGIMLIYNEIRNNLLTLSKQCQVLWEENKDMQGRFVNDLAELQRIQMAIVQIENEQRLDQLNQAQQTMYIKIKIFI